MKQGGLDPKCTRDEHEQFDDKRSRILGVSAAFRVRYLGQLAILAFVVATALNTAGNSLATFWSESSELTTPRTEIMKELSAAINTEIESGRLVAYDYSLGWSIPQVADKCTSLIFGDSFSLEVIADKIIQKCPGIVLAGFYENEIWPIAPFRMFDPDRRLIHANYCADLANAAEDGPGLSIVTPDSNFPYLRAERIVTEDGWLLSRVQEIDCTGSPIRNERPNPATLAARARIAELPVIGPIYRNWPFRDGVKQR